MSFKAYLSEALGSTQSPLETVIDRLQGSKLTRRNQQHPDKNTVYNRELTNTLAKVSGMLTTSRKLYEEWQEGRTTRAAQREGAQDFATITEAILDYKPDNHSETLGSALEEQLLQWMETRAMHLDREHQHAVQFHESRRTEPHIVDTVVYRFEDLEQGKQHTASVQTETVKQNSPPPRSNEEALRRDNMRFPTEDQAKLYFHENFGELLDRAGWAEQLTVANKYRDGVVRVTAENTTRLRSGQNPPKIISRTKQGRIGKVDSESLKLFKSLTGLRTENGKNPYSYDSIAIWHTNLSEQDVIETALHYYHDSQTSNGGRTKETPQGRNAFYEAAPAGQSGYGLQAQNHTPGSPFDFHRRLSHIAQRSDTSSLQRTLAKRQPDNYECTKQRYINRWLNNEDPQNNTESEFRSMLNEASETLAADYKAFLRGVIKPRDYHLARHGDDSPYTFPSTVTGFKGPLIRRHESLTREKRGSVNVPLEARINDDERPDREGAGYRSNTERGDGIGRGRHTAYKQKRLGAAQRLKEQGMFEAYKLIQQRVPKLGD